MSCSQRKELQQLLRLGHWPDAATAEMRAHVKSCSGCSDHVLLTQAFHEARTETSQTLNLEPASIIWWRAQLRKRRTAIEAMDRPIRRAQTFAVAICLAVGIAVGIWTWRSGTRWMTSGWLHQLSLSTAGLSVMVIAAILAMMCGIAVYLSVERD